MTKRDDLTRIKDMLDYAREATEMVRVRQRADLDRDRMFQLALVRVVEIVGEAAAQESQAGRRKYAGIPWERAVGMRNRLIHGYGDVDLDILWNTVVEDLPPLVSELEKIVLPQ